MPSVSAIAGLFSSTVACKRCIASSTAGSKALMERFGDVRVSVAQNRLETSARHNLSVFGYWITRDASENSSSILCSYASREQAKKNWEAFHADGASNVARRGRDRLEEGRLAQEE